MSKHGIRTGVDFDRRPAPQIEATKPIIEVTDRDLCVMDEGELVRLNTGADKGEYILTFCAA